MDGSTDRKNIYGLIGKNISYSLSPVLHNAAFAYYDLPSEYKLFDLEEGQVEKFISDIFIDGNTISGLNVTVPYKIKILDIIEGMSGCRNDSSAVTLGALNTVEIKDGGLIGHNTDGRGFHRSLMEDTGFNVKDKKVCIFGTGGAGRAIALFLASLDEHPARISLYDKDEKMMCILSQTIRENNPLVSVEELKQNEVNRSLSVADLAINATPLGTHENDPEPFDVGVLRDEAVVYDLVYCRETKIISKARARGLVATGGLGMLINQAAVAFHIWTYKPIDETAGVMRDAAVKLFDKR